MASEELKNAFSYLGIGEDRIESASVREVIVAFRKLAKKMHPDKVGLEKVDKDKATAAFQILSKNYQLALTYIVDRIKSKGDTTNHKEYDNDDVRFTKDNFKNFNFPKENEGSFTVFVQNELANHWEEALENKYGIATIESTAKGKAFGKNWKVSFSAEDKSIELTVHFYNKPLRPKRSKVFIQGGNRHNQSLLHMYVFDELPLIYKDVCKKLKSIEKDTIPDINLPYLARLRKCTQYKCDICDFATSKQALLKTHISRNTTRIDRMSNSNQPNRFLKNHQYLWMNTVKLTLSWIIINKVKQGSRICCHVIFVNMIQSFNLSWIHMSKGYIVETSHHQVKLLLKNIL